MNPKVSTKVSHRRLSAEEAAADRAAFMKNSILPFVATVFDKQTKLRSAVLCVGQFSTGEAPDAVHEHFVWSELESPDIQTGLASTYEDKDPVNLPTLHLIQTDFLDGWDENGDVIGLVAAYCKEDCDDDMAMVDCYLPFAVFRRHGKGVNYLLAPNQRRPWLDGVRSVLDPETGENDQALYAAIYKTKKGEPVIDGSTWWESVPGGLSS